MGKSRPRRRASHQFEARGAYRDGWLMGLAELMQPLTTLADQVLAAGQTEIPIGCKGPGQLHKPQPLGLSDASEGLREGAGHKATKTFLAPLEIAKTPFSLQLQGLLQGLEPGLKALWGQGVSGGGGLGLGP